MKGVKNLWLLAFLISSCFCIHAQTQIGEDIDGLLAGDRFGQGVSISSNGNIAAIVGFSSTNGDGRIRVFENIDGVWTLYGTDINGENFGGVGAFSVSLSEDGKTIAYSSLGNTLKVFGYNSATGIWSQKGNDIHNTTSISNYGYSIKLSSDGNTIVIGTPDSPIVPEVGVTQIFRFETDTWNQVGNDISGWIPVDHSGRSVDMSSDANTIAIMSDTSVRVYQNVSDNWVLLGNEIPATGSQFHNKGVSLSADGSILAIGEPEYTNSLIQQGRVRVFNYASDSWNQVGTDIIGELAHYRTGSSVCLSADGQILVIGEIGSDSSLTDTGRTRIFKNQVDEWSQIGNSIYGEANLDYSGTSVSLSSDASTLIIGADLNDGNGVDSGHARIYDLSTLLSIHDSELSQINLFPNPVKDQFTIQLPEEIVLENVSIYNSIGKLVHNNNSKVMNTSKLSTGIYFVEIHTNKGKETKKIVVL